MITKATVEQVLNKHTVKVRIPILDKVINSSTGTPIENYQIATECVLPNFSYNFTAGDIVFVDFEENNMDSPVIIGYLTNTSNQRPDGKTLSVSVESESTLPADTNIGAVKKEEIECLKGISANIQNSIDSANNNTFSSDIGEIEEKIGDLETKLSSASDTISAITESCVGTSNTILESDSNFNNRFQSVRNNLNLVLKKIGDIGESENIADLISELEARVAELEDSYANGYIPVPQTTIEPLDEPYSTLYQCIMYDSYNYTHPMYTDMKPVGVLWHDTAGGNPNLCRYVQPSKRDKNYEYLMNLIGKNTGGNDWNTLGLINPDHKAGLNAWVGKLADGSVATVQSLPWTWRPNGCGSGDKGSCNDGWLQFEICDDGYETGTKTYFDKAYNEAVKLTAYLCKKFGINPKGTVVHNGVTVPTILCHKDSNDLELGSAHGDIYIWFKKYGKTMDNVRNDVQNLINSTQNESESDVPVSNSGESKVNDALKDEVQQFLNNRKGDCGVYVEELSTKSNIYAYKNTKFDEQVVSASLIKLWVAGAVYEKIEAGVINESDVKTDLYNMITVSSNDACNRLVKLLGNNNREAGIAAVNAFASEYNFEKTKMTRLMLESTGTQNYTSIKDCAKFLRMLYEGKLVSSSSSNKLLEIMKDAHRIYAAAGLPSNVKFAHKTGTLTNLCYGDVGIVYIDKPYILCVINNGTNDSVLKDVSKLIYDSLV